MECTNGLTGLQPQLAVVHLAESLHHIGLGPVKGDREPAPVQTYRIYVALPSWLKVAQMGYSFND